MAKNNNFGDFCADIIRTIKTERAKNTYIATSDIYPYQIPSYLRVIKAPGNSILVDETKKFPPVQSLLQEIADVLKDGDSEKKIDAQDFSEEILNIPDYEFPYPIVYEKELNTFTWDPVPNADYGYVYIIQKYNNSEYTWYDAETPIDVKLDKMDTIAVYTRGGDLYLSSEESPPERNNKVKVKITNLNDTTALIYDYDSNEVLIETGETVEIYVEYGARVYHISDDAMDQAIVNPPSGYEFDGEEVCYRIVDDCEITIPGFRSVTLKNEVPDKVAVYIDGILQSFDDSTSKSLSISSKSTIYAYRIDTVKDEAPDIRSVCNVEYSGGHLDFEYETYSTEIDGENYKIAYIPYYTFDNIENNGEFAIKALPETCELSIYVDNDAGNYRVVISESNGPEYTIIDYSNSKDSEYPNLKTLVIPSGSLIKVISEAGLHVDKSLDIENSQNLVPVSITEGTFGGTPYPNSENYRITGDGELKIKSIR